MEREILVHGFQHPRAEESAVSTVKLWVDDERQPPEGWLWARNFAEAVQILESGVNKICVISIDYDLGSGDPNGMDLLQHMDRCGLWPTDVVHVHSTDIYGKAAMTEFVKKHFTGNRKPSPVHRVRLQTPALDLPREILIQHRIPWWIDPAGSMIKLRDKDHALSAIEILGKRGFRAVPEEAIAQLVDEGWIRVQVYPDQTAFLQGTSEALVRRGVAILKIAPDLKAVEIGFIPADERRPPVVLAREEIDRIGWQSAVLAVERISQSNKREDGNSQ